MTRLCLPAPAKLNLFLHITGRRADGYHTLQTLFQLLDRGDLLTFEASGDENIQLLTNLPGVAAEDNLILRAAKLLQPFANTRAGVRIELDKRLPMGGGIGGGSSDAATTLLALNRLWDCGFSLSRLSQLGLELGADVPVFVEGRSAWAEGVGEQLQAIDLPEKWFLVITPDCQVSTARIFAREELTRDSAAITVAAFFEQGGRNDCQAVVETLYPEVAEAREWLQQYSPAQLTGTGASIFAAFESQTAAHSVLAQSPWQGFIAQGVNHSPVHEQLKQWRG